MRYLPGGVRLELLETDGVQFRASLAAKYARGEILDIIKSARLSLTTSTSLPADGQAATAAAFHKNYDQA